MSEKEYIEREALIERLKFKRDNGTHKVNTFAGLESAIAQVKKAPTADVVEVVRCKDCVRWSPDGGYGLDLDGAKRLYGECVITNFSHKENHFCSYGVSKMNGKGDEE